MVLEGLESFGGTWLMLRYPGIRHDHRISVASWSSDDDLWTVEATHTGNGEELRFTTGFL